MRVEFVVAGAVMAMSAGITAAGSEECCGNAPPLPRVVYALPPTPSVIPPTGYVLDPSDAAKPVYPVDPRPYVSGFGAGLMRGRPIRRAATPMPIRILIPMIPMATVRAMAQGSPQGFPVMRPPPTILPAPVFTRASMCDPPACRPTRPIATA
jgi:hypothetical protein